MEIWAYDTIVREIWVMGFTGRVAIFEGDSARVGKRVGLIFQDTVFPMSFPSSTHAYTEGTCKKEY
jgi:hypothetical protein